MAVTGDYERFLSGAELARLCDALSESVRSGVISQVDLAAVLLLIFTPCHHRDILALRWEHVDLENKRLELPAGEAGRTSVRLTPAALAVLEAIERDADSPYVLPGARPDAHLTRLQGPWLRVSRAADLADLRLDDLRDVSASVGVAAGLSLPSIAALVHLRAERNAAKAVAAAPEPDAEPKAEPKAEPEPEPKATAETPPEAAAEPEPEPAAAAACEDGSGETAGTALLASARGGRRRRKQRTPAARDIAPTPSTGMTRARARTVPTPAGRAPGRDLSQPTKVQVATMKSRRTSRREAPAVLLALAALTAVFVLIPLLLYTQFEAAENDKRSLLLSVAQQQGRQVAQALRPLLERQDADSLALLNAELAQYSDGDMRIKVLLRPSGVTSHRNFFYVASMPQLPIEQFKREQAEIVETGVLNKLLTTCDGDSPLASIYTNAAGEKETLTSVTPVTASLGCWVVITAYPTAAVAGSSNGQPYWMKAEIRTAAAIYAAMALLIVAVVYGMSRRRRKLETALGDIERTNRRLERTLADANAASDSKNRLLEVLGHELRKPLTAILDLAETMSREEFGPLGSRHYKKQLTGIVENTSQQLSIIDELLDGSAIEARAIELHEGVVDLLPIIDGCRDEAMKRAAETGVKLVAALPKQLPQLIADGRLLRQMVLGLLAGSLRWTPNGGRITLGAEHLRNGELAVWVADTAGGIDGANRETAPAPADSLAEVVNLPDRDAGSGLPTVKSLIEAHGGRLELKEQAGAGTVATLLFPSERVRALVGGPSPLRVAG